MVLNRAIYLERYSSKNRWKDKSIQFHKGLQYTPFFLTFLVCCPKEASNYGTLFLSLSHLSGYLTRWSHTYFIGHPKQRIVATKLLIARTTVSTGANRTRFFGSAQFKKPLQFHAFEFVHSQRIFIELVLSTCYSNATMTFIMLHSRIHSFTRCTSNDTRQ